MDGNNTTNLMPIMPFGNDWCYFGRDSEELRLAFRALWDCVLRCAYEDMREDQNVQDALDTIRRHTSRGYRICCFENALGLENSGLRVRAARDAYIGILKSVGEIAAHIAVPNDLQSPF